MFAKFEALLRKAPCTGDAPWDNVDHRLDAFGPADCRDYTVSGYAFD